MFNSQFNTWVFRYRKFYERHTGVLVLPRTDECASTQPAVV